MDMENFLISLKNVGKLYSFKRAHGKSQTMLENTAPLVQLYDDSQESEKSQLSPVVN